MAEPTVPWWRPDRLAARRAHLEARGRIRDALRAFFAAEGFTEVETPALQISPGLEPHLQAFATQLHDSGGGDAKPRYLHTSPEFAMKKLLAGGMQRIWQLGHVFRDGERGATHHPEFTMLEWYRAGATHRDLMDDCENVLRAAQAAVLPPLTPTLSPQAGRRSVPPNSPSLRINGEREGPVAQRWEGEGQAAGASAIASMRWRNNAADASLPFERLPVAEAFKRHTGIDILAAAPDAAHPDFALLTAAAEKIGIAPHVGDDWEALYFRIFLERIEPHLGIGAPTILYDYPVSMAALSRKKPDDPRLAERFELYVCGLELANAFQELTDPAEQRARFLADQARKQALYGTAYPIDDDFLAALEHGLPDSAGIALGFDRLVMLCTGADHIEDVLWAPVD
jgi:elongation factor P--(R)-beta-lysine ligase